MLFFQKIKENFIIAVFLLFALVAVYFILNVSYYFDPLNMCRIGIEGDILGGNDKTIRKALARLKKEDFESYKMVCQNIETISENRCTAADPRIEGSWLGWDWDGCYIKGSRVVYLKPEEEDTGEIVQKRMKMIKKYAEHSKDFWKTHQD